MKKIVDVLGENGFVFKSLVKVEPSSLRSRQKVKIFSAVDEKSFYNAIFILNNKSRFLRGSAIKLMELEERLEIAYKHSYRVKILLISSPVCSLAKKFLKENRWKIVEVQNGIV